MRRPGRFEISRSCRNLIAAVGIAMLFGFGGCATSEPEAVYTPPPPQPVAVAPVPTPPPPPPPATTANTEVRHATASWYGPGLDGHETSTGERFNQNEMTAASKNLPVGSHVEVTNP